MDLGDGSDWGKEIQCFCEYGNGNCIFIWFYHFLFFVLVYVYWTGQWPSEMPSDCNFLGLLL